MKQLSYAAMTLVLFLVGCKTDVTIEVFSSDLRAVSTENRADMMTPMTMAIEIPSTDKCDEYGARIADVMKGLVHDFAPQGCKRNGMDSRLLAAFQVPLKPSMEAWKKAPSLFGVTVGDAESAIRVAVVLSLEKYDLLTKRMRAEFHQRINLAESKVTVVLNNDERTPLTIYTGGVFLNKDPVHAGREFNLKRRGKAVIELSNVSSAFLAKHGHAGVVVLKKAS